MSDPGYDAVHEYGLSLPEAYEETPWGHPALKVKGKSFAFMGYAKDGGWSLSVKLPQSNLAALSLPCSQPTGYGLGKSGWVTARFAEGEGAPVPMLEEWLEESYRAFAPKRLLKQLDSGASGAVPPAAPKVRKPARKPAATEDFTVLVVSEDAARSERACRGLAEQGLPAVSAKHADFAPRLRGLRLLLFDLGRKPMTGLKLLAACWQALEKPPALVIAGIRDQRTQARVAQGFPEALLLRGAPGHPEVLRRVQELCA